MTCSICCSEFTSHVRPRVDCPGCNVAACTACVKHYLLTTTADPHCMNCRLDWSPEFLDSILSASFRRGELAKHRKTVLLMREKALLPATTGAAAREKRRREIVAQAEEVRREVKKLRAQLEHARALHRDLENYANAPNESGTAASGNIVSACPSDGCRGFVSAVDWACVLCRAQVCASCKRVDTGDGSHACSEDDVQTARLLARETKGCPTCKIPISKIDGCDQMFCVSCTTTFNWTTCAIQKHGAIHNPEYFRWMRDRGMQVPRNPYDTPCGDPLEVPQIGRFDDYLRGTVLPEADKATLRRFFEILSWDAIKAQEYRRFAQLLPDDPNEDLRVSYLLGEISEKDWETNLIKRENANKSAAAARSVCEMLVMAGNDIIRRFMAGDKTSLYVMVEIDALRLYYNQCVETLAQRRVAKLGVIDKFMNRIL